MYNKNIKVKGLSRFHKTALNKLLKECDIADKIEIKFNDTISLHRLHSLWYGGNMADVKYKGYTFHIEARRDIYAYLYTTKSKRRVCYVKDKCNNGNFGAEMVSYIRSDKTLYKALNGEHHLYELILDHNNWWECFVTDPNDQFHDLMWCLNEDNLFLTFNEVFDNLDETIKYIEGDAA